MRVSFKKYNTETFSMIDSLSIDTIFKKNGELDTDTLIDYYKLSRKDIQFKTLDNLDSEGFLFVRDKEISEYNLLENNVPSNKTFGQKNEAKTKKRLMDCREFDFVTCNHEIFNIYWICYISTCC